MLACVCGSISVFIYYDQIVNMYKINIFLAECFCLFLQIVMPDCFFFWLVKLMMIKCLVIETIACALFATTF